MSIVTSDCQTIQSEITRGISRDVFPIFDSMPTPGSLNVFQVSALPGLPPSFRVDHKIITDYRLQYTITVDIYDNVSMVS